MTRTNDIYPFAIQDSDGAPIARTGLPVVVIGAGPVGLAAAHLLDRGLEPLVLEAGSQVGANIAQWGHVRLFSPWCLALDPVSVRLLEQSGWTGPDPDALPTGADLLEDYLTPLAALPALASRIRLHTRVVAVVAADVGQPVGDPGAGVGLPEGGQPGGAQGLGWVQVPEASSTARACRSRSCPCGSRTRTRKGSWSRAGLRTLSTSRRATATTLVCTRMRLARAGRAANGVR